MSLPPPETYVVDASGCSSSQSTIPQTFVDEKAQQDSSPSISTEPLDGGVRAWLTVVGSWFCMFSTLGYLYSFGVYQDFYTRIFLRSCTASQISWMGSVQLAIPYLLGVPMGKLFDRGYLHSLLGLGSVIFLFSLFMTSLAKPDQYYQVFLSQGIGMGLGMGLIQLPATTIVSRHFAKRRAFAYGIMLSGASIGSLIFPIVLNRLIYTIGFGDAVRASGYISLGGLVIGNLLVRKPLHQPPRSTTTPSMIGFIRDPAFMFFIVGLFIAFFGFYFPIIYLQLYAVEHSIDTTLAFYSLAILNGASAIGRLLGNFTADKLGLWNVQVPWTFVTALTIWLVLVIKNIPSLVVVSALYGIFSGGWLSLSLAVCPAMAKSPAEVGARTGVTMGAVGVAVLFSAPIQGAVLGSDYQWIRSVAVSASFMLLGAILTLVAGILSAKGIRGRPAQ